MKNTLGVRCLKLAVLYALLGISAGIMMAASHNFSHKSLHAHINLAGWVSLGIMGLIYLALPAVARTRLATAHFWLHNIGLPIMLIGVFLIYSGQPEAGEPFAKSGSSILGLGFVCFALNLWLNAGKQDQGQAESGLSFLSATTGARQPAGGSGLAPSAPFVRRPDAQPGVAARAVGVPQDYRQAQAGPAPDPAAARGY